MIDGHGEFSRECPLLAVSSSLAGEQKPENALAITVDNGSELASKEVDAWACKNGIAICPDKPVENAYLESFNGRLRDKCVNAHMLFSLKEASSKVEAVDEYRRSYNSEKPHNALDYMMPNELAAQQIQPGVTIKEWRRSMLPGLTKPIINTVADAKAISSFFIYHSLINYTY